MNSDDFEKRIQRQTIRSIPDEWRREILRAAETPASRRPRFFSTFSHQLSTLLWPCPQAWAGLAAVWLVILTLNFAMQGPQTHLAKAAPPTPSEIALLKEQRRLYFELAGLQAKEFAEPPKTASPAPRSDSGGKLKFV